MTNFVKYNKTHYIKAISSLSSKAMEIQKLLIELTVF